MDQFEKEKKDFLGKLDKSKKGTVDEQIIKLLDTINSKEGFYTTSSCAGRILLVEIGMKKDDSRFIFSAHRKVRAEEILAALNQKTKDKVVLQQQNIILHIACKDIGRAKEILECSKAIGLKHTGIISITPRRIIIEIRNPVGMSLTVKQYGKTIISEDYLRLIIAEMNEKLEENYRKLEKLNSSLKKLL